MISAKLMIGLKYLFTPLLLGRYLSKMMKNAVISEEEARSIILWKFMAKKEEEMPY